MHRFQPLHYGLTTESTFFVVGSEKRIFSAIVRISRSRSSKVDDFGTNQCDFLLGRHSNLGPI